MGGTVGCIEAAGETAEDFLLWMRGCGSENGFTLQLHQSNPYVALQLIEIELEL